MKASGRVFKYGDNVDTDVIIPARYLNSSDPAELATHCMEDIDPNFIHQVQKATLLSLIKTLAAVHPVSTHRSQSRQPVSAASLQRPLRVFFTATRSISDFRSLSVRKHQKESNPAMK